MLKKLFITFILFQSICLYAQQIAEPYIYDNLAITTFQTKYGNIKTYFPLESIGETVSFTVKLEPVGNNPRQQERNLQQLRNYSLQIGDHTFLLQQEIFSLEGLNSELNQLNLLLDSR